MSLRNDKRRLTNIYSRMGVTFGGIYNLAYEAKSQEAVDERRIEYRPSQHHELIGREIQ